MSDWIITLPSAADLQGRFAHPQVLQNPNPVQTRDGSDSAFASFQLLAGIVNVDEDDWQALKATFAAAIDIGTSAMAQDYVAAISQTLALGEQLQGEWRDHRAEIEVGLRSIEVRFSRSAGAAGPDDAYYAYVLQAPNCRWDRFVDDVDLLPATMGQVHCNVLSHGENGQHISVGKPRRAQARPTSGYGDYWPWLNIGVGRLPRAPLTHRVDFNVRAFVTTPDDWLVEDVSQLWEKDPYMATRIRALKLIVAAGTTSEIAQRTGVGEARIRELLGLKEPARDASEEPPQPPAEPAPEPAPREARRPPFFRPHVRPGFVPRNALAAGFVALFEPQDLERVSAIVASFAPLRRRRLAAGLGLQRESDTAAVVAHLREAVFIDA